MYTIVCTRVSVHDICTCKPGQMIRPHARNNWGIIDSIHPRMHACMHAFVCFLCASTANSLLSSRPYRQEVTYNQRWSASCQSACHPLSNRFNLPLRLRRELGYGWCETYMLWLSLLIVKEKQQRTLSTTAFCSTPSTAAAGAVAAVTLPSSPGSGPGVLSVQEVRIAFCD